MNCSKGIVDADGRASTIDDLNNNIFYNNTTHLDLMPTGTVSCDYNLFYGTGNWIWNSGAQATFADWKTASSGDANSVNADPLFVGGSPYSYYLQAESPAIDAGTDVGLTEDYEGNTIIDLPDIGAFESNY